MTLILSGTDGISDIDGTAATPAIRGTDANTGIFFGADIIGFSEGGVEAARINADSQFVAAAGTAALPVITTTGDTNTGIFFPAADTIAFSEGGVEAMRINSESDFLLGVTSAFNSGKQCLAFSGDTRQGLNIRNNADNPSDVYVGFYNAFGTNTGAIRSGGSTTSYNTSSDYRLKENVQPLVNALDKVMALKPVSYTWKSGGEDNGFIAHDLQLILPKAVSGEKDAVNEDDTINPQGVDYSKIVATLTAAIQELKALVDTQANSIQSLTTRITALETP